MFEQSQKQQKEKPGLPGFFFADVYAIAAI